MKRSEMIQDMASKIILRLIDYKIDLSYDKAQDLAEELLNSQKEHGMLPPTIKTNEFNGHISDMYKNEWEEE